MPWMSIKASVCGNAADIRSMCWSMIVDLPAEMLQSRQQFVADQILDPPEVLAAEPSQAAHAERRSR